MRSRLWREIRARSGEEGCGAGEGGWGGLAGISFAGFGDGAKVGVWDLRRLTVFGLLLSLPIICLGMCMDLLRRLSVVVDLLPGGNVAKSARRDAVRPPNAKRSDVRRILDAAAAHAVELNEL